MNDIHDIHDMNDTPDHNASPTLPPAQPETSAAPAALGEDAPAPGDIPVARQEAAIALYSQGYRTTAIAARLGVTPRAVRYWLKDAREAQAAETRAARKEHLYRAIESHRAIAIAAWEAYEYERETDRALLNGAFDYVRRRINRPVDAAHTTRRIVASDPDSAPVRDDGAVETIFEEIERPHRVNQSARHLALALAAQREIARLQGLYDHVEPEQKPQALRIVISPLPGEAAATPPAPPQQPSNTDTP